MSDINAGSIKYISREELSKLLLSPTGSSITIIDVRDWDRVGGHIKGSVNVPVDKFDWRVPELVRTLKSKDMIVFHCQMSQERGPRSALNYMREKQRLDAQGASSQQVVVLEGGFNNWQKM
jgi:rhodanese-related sulfurtransferase